MKKNFFKFLLLGVMALSLGVVGCKDYDDDIDRIDEEIDDLSDRMAEAERRLTALESSLGTPGDDGEWATKDYVDAAKAEAIAEAQKLIEDAELGGLDDAALNAKIANALEVLLEGEDNPLSALVDRVGVIEAALALQKAALEKYGFGTGDNAIDAAIAAIKDAQDRLGDLTKEELASIVEKIDEIDEALNVMGGVLGELKSLAYIPEWMDNGNPAVLFQYIRGIDGAKPFAISSTQEMIYRLNPTTADTTGIKWGFVNRNMLETRAVGDNYDLLSVNGKPTFAQGALTFKVTGNADKRRNDIDPSTPALDKFDYPGMGGLADWVTGANPANGMNEGDYPAYKADYAWLRAQGDGAEILSDRVKVWFDETFAFIGDPQLLAKYPEAVDPTFGTKLYLYDYATDSTWLTRFDNVAVWDAMKETAVGKESYLDAADSNIDWLTNDTQTTPFKTQTTDGDGDNPDNWVSHYIAYAEDGVAAEYDLNDYVFATVWKMNGKDIVARITMEEAKIEGYKFRFSEYSWTPNEPGYGAPATDDPTDQSKFVTLDPATGKFVVTFNDETAPYTVSTSAINRLPIFKAELLAPNGVVIARHYIKFQITDKAIELDDIEPLEIGRVDYLDLYAAESVNRGEPGISDWNVYTAGNGGVSPYFRVYGMTADTEVEANFGTPVYALKNALTWQRMNDLYDQLGLSHDQFLTIYGTTPVLSYDHVNTNATYYEDAALAADKHKLLLQDRGALEYNDWLSGNQSGTVPVRVWIHPNTRFGAHEWKVTFTSNSPRYPKIEIPVTFNLVPPVSPTFNSEYVEYKPGVVDSKGEPMPISVVKGKFIGTNFRMQKTLQESFLANMDTWVDRVVDSIVPIASGTNPMFISVDDGDIKGYQAHVFAFEFNDKAANLVNRGWEPNYQGDAGYNGYLPESNDPTTTINETAAGPALVNAWASKSAYMEGRIDAVANPTAGADPDSPTWYTQNAHSTNVAGPKNVYAFRGQDIRLQTPIYDDFWIFKVIFRSTYENQEDIDVEFLVRFDNPLEASLDDIQLATEADPDAKRLENYLHVSVTSPQTAIFTPGTPGIGSTADSTARATLNATEAVRYGITTTGTSASTYSNTLPWAIDYSKTSGQNQADATATAEATPGREALYISNADDNVYDQTSDYFWAGAPVTLPAYSIFWQNAGTVLLQNRTFTDAVSVTVTAGGATPYAKRTVSGDIVELKTVNVVTPNP